MGTESTEGADREDLVMEPVPETREALSRIQGGSDEDLMAALKDLGRRAREIVPECVGLSLGLVRDGVTFTLVATAEDLAAIDAAQYLEGGPCVRDDGGADTVEVVDVVARTDVAHAEKMRWDVTDHGFRMALSPRVPQVLEKHVAGVVTELLAPHGLVPHDVRGWAVHPGGPRILDVVCDRLGLAETDLTESTAVLSDHGNCSSGTVLLVLDRICGHRELADGDAVVMMAFGPGLTLYAALLGLVVVPQSSGRLVGALELRPIAWAGTPAALAAASTGAGSAMAIR